MPSADPVQGAPDAVPPLMRWWAAAALAAAAGVALLLAFPPYDLWWLAPAGVAALALAAYGRGLRAGAGLGMITGLVFFAPLLAWTNLHVGYAPWVLLAVLEAGYLALLGAAAAALTPLLRRWPLLWPLATGVLWVAQEALRSRAPFGGFPWGRLAFSQADSPALGLAALGGAPLVTFAVALSGGLLAAAVLRNRWLLPLAALPLLAGLLAPVAHPAGDPVQVAIVQGNVPRMGLDFNAQRRAVLDNHVNATVALAAEVAAGRAAQPDVVIWPENASDIDPLRNEDAAEQISRAATAIGAPILVGAVLAGPGAGQSQNAGIVWEPGSGGGSGPGPGPGEQYLKQHPVPFAEYMPMRALIEPIAQAITNEAKLLRTDFVAGAEPGVLQAGPVRLGDVICFEVAYDNVVRDGVRHGAQLLTVQTNNATFDVAEARQQLAMVRLRAVEHGRDSLMASTVGISGFVTADGSVHQASQFNTPATLLRQLHGSDDVTLATRAGVWPEAALAAAAVLLLVLALINRRRWL